MNIQEAKQTVIDTVRAYTARDEQGNYRIPPVRQRPILLMGPPGIGKTAVVEQAARECGVGLMVLHTHAFRSDVQLLQCTIATRSPAGVVTRSISS